MAKLPLLVLARAVRALAERPLPAITILTEVHADGARIRADLAVVDDVARADDGFRFGTGVVWVFFVGLDGFHVQVEDALHLLHGGLVLWAYGKI